MGTLLYAATGGLWIIFSDRVLLGLGLPPEAYATMQTWKGGFFVAATSVVLFLILERQFSHRAHETARLREATRRLRHHVENTPLALVEWDADFRVTRWSDQAHKLFGWSEDEVLGLTWADWDSVHPDDLELVNARVEVNRQTGVTGFVSRNRNLTKDGEVLWCEWYNSWIRDDQGEVRSMLSLIHDITPERVAMEEVQRLNRELEQRVHRRTEELAQANADLKAFTYSVSHDLRAPVRAIVGLGEIMERRYLDDLPPEASQYLSLILSAGSQMDRLIQGLMEYARLEAGISPTTQVNLHRIMKAAMDTVQAGMDTVQAGMDTVQAGMDKEAGEVQIEGRLPEALGQEDLLFRVFHNLLENAFQYRDPSRPLEVRIRGELGTGAARLFVTDNGLGIPPEDRTRVFGLFERAHQDPLRPGSGLGLSIVKRSMELMGGHVVIMDSPDGLGVTFVLVLPRPGSLSSSDLE
ncbi:MAG: PAS domain-containing sensor histidine kinase [Gemmatimonadota bacterium]